MSRKRTPNTFSLPGAFDQLQKRLAADLGASDVAYHPGAKGDNAELNWVAMLRKFLPRRYCVDSAFVVDVNGAASEQIDVVIYDSQYSPLLFHHKRGLYIPAESVYAVFEVKQKMSKNTIEYAGGKVASVRTLERTSANIRHAGGTFAAQDPKPIIGGLLTTRSVWSPPFGDPFHAALDARAVAERLDLGCALNAGSFEYTVDTGDAAAVTVQGAPQALLFFALRLFHRLQQLGTVTALDIDRWSAAAFGASKTRIRV